VVLRDIVARAVLEADAEAQHDLALVDQLVEVLLGGLGDEVLAVLRRVLQGAIPGSNSFLTLQLCQSPATFNDLRKLFCDRLSKHVQDCLEGGTIELAANEM